MPIYEYLCSACNRIYSFMAASYAETQRRTPVCPRCGATDLRKQFSRFAVGSGGSGRKSGDSDMAASGDEADAGGPEMPEDPRVEQEMMQLMNEAEGIDDNDPRQIGRLMRRMSEITGEPVEPAMDEAIRRLERGEDMESIEADLGELLDAEEDSTGGGPSPSHDNGLYQF